ncbi:MAG: hypothetical protein WCT77_02940 [Bacteroidota bacterium]
MARKQSDSLVRAIADATEKDFYWVERELTAMIKDVMSPELEKYQSEIEMLKNIILEKNKPFVAYDKGGYIEK